MCFDNLIGVAEGCTEKSRSGLYLSDLPELNGLLVDCCEDDVYLDAKKRISVAEKLIKNKLLLVASSEMTPKVKKRHEIGYAYRNLIEHKKGVFKGVVLKVKDYGKGTNLKIKSILIPTPKGAQPTKVKVQFLNKNLEELHAPISVEANKKEYVDIDLYVCTEKTYILYDAIETVKVMDACTCSGWTQTCDCNSPYFNSPQGRSPSWAKDMIIGGVNIDNLTELEGIEKASKQIDICLDVEVGCDVSAWVCANPYNDNNPLDVSIAQALLYLSASLIMKAVLSDTTISRSNLIARESASYYADTFNEQAEQYVDSAIDFVTTNHANFDSCMTCKKPRMRHGLLR